MADLACTLMNIGSDSTSCMENYAGIGTYILVAMADDLSAEPDYDNTKAEFTSASFAFKENKGFYKIKIKPQSGQVTSESNGSGRGFSNVITGIIDKDMEDASFVLRVMNNSDIIAMAPDGKGKYYVAYDKTFRPTLSVSSTTGNTPDSDSGHTITITQNPSPYPLVKWAGTPTMAKVQTQQVGDV